MSLWLQNLIILLAVLACAAFIARSGYRALQGRKSKLNSCGSCGGCATTPAKPASQRIDFLPAEMLVKKR